MAYPFTGFGAVASPASTVDNRLDARARLTLRFAMRYRHPPTRRIIVDSPADIPFSTCINYDLSDVGDTTVAGPARFAGRIR